MDIVERAAAYGYQASISLAYPRTGDSGTGLCSRNGRIKSFPSHANLIFIVRVVRNGMGGIGISPMGRTGTRCWMNAMEVRNYHRTFKEVYELCGRVDKKHPIFKDRGSRDYPRSSSDNLASYIYKYGHEVMDERN